MLKMRFRRLAVPLAPLMLRLSLQVLSSPLTLDLQEALLPMIIKRPASKLERVKPISILRSGKRRSVMRVVLPALLHLLPVVQQVPGLQDRLSRLDLKALADVGVARIWPLLMITSRPMLANGMMKLLRMLGNVPLSKRRSELMVPG